LSSGRIVIFAEVETLLKSKVLTEDAIIFQIIEAVPETTQIEKIEQTLLSYLNPAYSNIKKKMLFMEQILDSLWNILDKAPSQKGTIFFCFIETVHPIVTNKTDFGYVKDVLQNYLENKFDNAAVFSSFAETLTESLDPFMDVQEEEQRLIYTSMCFGLILKVIYQSYEINRMEDPDFDTTPFDKLIRSVSQFLSVNANERVKGYLYKSLFDTNTIQLCCKLISERDLCSLLTQEWSYLCVDTIV